MDSYNPLYEYNLSVPKESIEEFLNLQNRQFGADKWYPFLIGLTPESFFLELRTKDVQKIAEGNLPENIYFKALIDCLISTGFLFVKTLFKSSHSFKPLKSFEDFKEEMSNPNIIISFRRYKCNYLFFRKWIPMNLETRVYVYDREVKYIEVYRDLEKKFKPEFFIEIKKFVSEEVIPRLAGLYKDFTVDLYLKDDLTWGVVEINSPLWLKAGTYLIKYDWEKDRIHKTEKTICRYEVQERCEVDNTTDTFVEEIEI